VLVAGRLAIYGIRLPRIEDAVGKLTLVSRLSLSISLGIIIHDHTPEKRSNDIFIVEERKWGMYVHERNSEIIGRDHIACGLARPEEKNGIIHHASIT
jgi:hypothetical protein